MPKERKRRQRRVRGTGSVFWDNARGVHVAKQIVGRTASGKPKWLQRSGRTPVEASKRLAEALGTPAQPTGKAATVGEWAARWVAADTSRPRTIAVRTNSVKHHITPVLGSLRLRTLTTFDVETAVKKWSENVGSPNTVRLILSHLNTCLEAAVRAGLVPYHPAKGARRPSEVRKKIRPFTAAELTAIMDEAANRRTTWIIAPLAAVGCRIGEALALDVTDFDPDAGTLSISRTQDLDRNTGPTKSSAPEGTQSTGADPDPTPTATQTPTDPPAPSPSPTRTKGPKGNSSSGEHDDDD